MTEDLKNIKWGKSFKWGIIKRTIRFEDRNGKLQPQYVVVDNQHAAFTSASRRVATDLTHEEASALCAIMNAGGDGGG